MALIETRRDRIVRLNSNGLGVTSTGAELPYTLQGELVEYEKHAYRGKENYVLKNIIEPSPRRVTPECKYYERCGGCLLQHLNKEDYEEFKRICHSGQASVANADPESCETKNVITREHSDRRDPMSLGVLTSRDYDAMQSMARNDVKNYTQLLTPQNPLRRRLNLVFKNSENGLHFGFYKYRSDKIVNIDSCVAAEKALSNLLPEIRKLLENISKPCDSGEVFLLQADNGIDVKILLDSKDIFNERNRGKLNSLVGKHEVIRLVYCHNKNVVLSRVKQRHHEPQSVIASYTKYGVAISGVYTSRPHGITTPTLWARDDVKKDDDYEPYVLFAGEKVSVEADCFLQPTKDSDKLLSDLVLKYIGDDKSKRVADLFCGRGTYTIPILKAGFRVSGFESDKNALGALRATHNVCHSGQVSAANADPESCETKNVITRERSDRRDPMSLGVLTSRDYDAMQSMARNDVKNDVYQRDLHYNPLSKELKDFEIIVINPPRAGALEQVNKILEFANIEKIVYISCSLESFNRDAKILEAKYKINQIAAIDQFLWNPHVEIVAELVPRHIFKLS